LLEFGDRVHNQKEEQFLFPLMVERGIPESGPIRGMLIEHEAERTLLDEMFAQAPGLTEATAAERADYAHKGNEYLAIRAEHIWKEHNSRTTPSWGRPAIVQPALGSRRREPRSASTTS
jgi:hemerythrin-like domain-containing protein